MHFLDLPDNSTPKGNPPKRYYLYGNSSFLIDIATKTIATWWGRDLIYADKANDLTIEDTLPLFGKPKAHVISTPLNPKTLTDYMIKHSKNKMGAKYKKEGFIEICCNELTPKQSEKFLSMLLEVKLSKDIIKYVCNINNYDAYLLWNMSSLLNIVLERKPDITHEELIFYCGNLSNVESFQAVNAFIKGDFNKFMTYINTTTLIPRQLIWAMSTMISKGVLSAHTNNWYYKNMFLDLNKLTNNPSKVSTYLYNIAVDFNASQEMIKLKLQRLIFYLKGFENNL